MSQLFKRASDEVLRANCFDPEWIVPHEGEDGPFAPYRIPKTEGRCPCCGGDAVGWTVVNTETAVGHSQDWFGADGEVEADETASMLNQAWAAGRRGALAADATDG